MTTVTRIMNRVRKRSDRERPVVRSNMSKMSGALINHCIYRTHCIYRQLGKRKRERERKHTKMLRVAPRLNSVLTDVSPKSDAIAKYDNDDTVRMTTAR
jgi:hypothetical protein